MTRRDVRLASAAIILCAALAGSRPGLAADSDQPELQAAFIAAFGHAAPFVVAASGPDFSKSLQGSRLTYTPSGLEPVAPGIVALISAGTLVEGQCHACHGTLAIHYLKQTGKDFSLLGAWPAIGGGAAYGQAATWSMRDDLDDVPLLITKEDDGGQGCYQTWADLIALTPQRPIVRAGVALATKYVPQTDETAHGYDLKATLVPVERGKVFAAQYSGTERFRVTYVRSGDVYVAKGKDLPVC